MNSFAPDDSEENTEADGTLVDPTKSIVTTISVETPLVLWENLDLSQDDLNTLGVEKAAAVAGIGEYSVEVDVPDYGTENVGGIFNYIYDQQYNNITSISVTNANGEEYTFDGINANHQYMDLGTVLTPGKNTISIKVCTDLTNRINNGEVKASGGIGPVQQEPQLSASGLTDASISFYTVE